MTSRYLIVNADDLGLSRGVNRGIARAHDQGIVTSASLMVRGAAAAEAARDARARPNLAVGLHVDLGEWSWTKDGWVRDRFVVDTEDEGAVRDEIARQLVMFHSLMGYTPTHLDSHQHVHRDEPVRTVLAGHALELDVPLRDCDRRVTHCGGFHAQDGKGASYPELVSIDAFARLVHSLGDGWTEMGCHPGVVDDALMGAYRREREHELTTLCTARAKRVLDACGVVLASFRDLHAS